MRVISQDGCVDIDYESFCFYIDHVYKDDDFNIKAENGKITVILASYKDRKDAIMALQGMSDKYKTIMIKTNRDNQDQCYITDEIVYEPDRYIESISIETLPNKIYKFPEDNNKDY